VAGSKTVSGQYGTLTVTVNAAGDMSWTYLLTGNAPHTGANQTGAADQLPEEFKLTFVDDDGSETDATLKVNINDDGPQAEDDTVANGAVTQADENAPVQINAFGNDKGGADGALASSVAFKPGSLTVDGVALSDADALARLTNNGNGTFTYQPAAGEAGKAVVFKYTITDADGDSAEGTVRFRTLDEDRDYDDACGCASGKAPPGYNTLIGGPGKDILIGGPGDDIIYGCEDDDELYGNGGNDILYGGSGNDFLTVPSGNNVLYGGSGDDELHGGSGNDKLYGGSGDDYLTANGGDNELYGGSGNDTLHGGPGNNLLVGGKGDDLMTTGGGNTTFAWMKGDAGTVDEAARDTIHDFNGPGVNVLDLADLLQGEENSSDLSKYLNFSHETAPEWGAVIKVSSTGDLQTDGSGYDQVIKLVGVGMLAGVDLFNGGPIDQNALINALIAQGTLVIDT